MNNTIYLFVGSVVLLLILAGLSLYALLRPAGNAPAPIGSIIDPFGGGPILPNGGSTSTGGQGSQVSQPPGTVAGFNGSRIQTRDFLKDPDVIQLVSRSGEIYYSLGSVPVDWVDDLATTAPITVPLNKDVGYDTWYFPEETTFSVVILSEPIAEKRKEMSLDFASRLDVPESALCNIISPVLISPAANEEYAGEHVGFPGCPGATKLPGD